MIFLCNPTRKYTLLLLRRISRFQGDYKRSFRLYFLHQFFSELLRNQKDLYADTLEKHPEFFRIMKDMKLILSGIFPHQKGIK